jgi:hypothetical protein
MYTKPLFEREKIVTLNLMEIEQPLGDAEAVILCSATVLCFRPSRHRAETMKGCFR